MPNTSENAKHGCVSVCETVGGDRDVDAVRLKPMDSLDGRSTRWSALDAGLCVGSDRCADAVRIEPVDFIGGCSTRWSSLLPAHASAAI